MDQAGPSGQQNEEQSCSGTLPKSLTLKRERTLGGKPETNWKTARDLSPTGSDARLNKDLKCAVASTHGVTTASRQSLKRPSAIFPTTQMKPGQQRCEQPKQEQQHRHQIEQQQQQQQQLQQQPQQLGRQAAQLGRQAAQRGQQPRDDSSPQALHDYVERQRETESRQRLQREILNEQQERRHVHEFMNNVLREIGDTQRTRRFRREDHFYQIKEIIKLLDRPRTVQSILQTQRLMEVCPMLMALQEKRRMQSAEYEKQAREIRNKCYYEGHDEAA